MKLMRSLVALGATGIIGAMFLFSNVAAEINPNIHYLGEEFQIAVSPTHIEMDLVPGSATTETFRLRNPGSQESDVKIGVASLMIDDDTTMLGTPRNEILEWVTLSLQPGCTPTRIDQETGNIFVHLRVKEECFIDVTANTPSNAPFGEQYFNVFFQEQEENEETGGVKMIRSIGMNVYATNRTGGGNGGRGDMCAEVRDQRIPFWLFEGPLATKATVENCGRLNFHSTIKIEVHNLFGTLVYKEEVANDRIIIAESTRVIRDDWVEAPMGIYRTKQTVEALGETYIKERWTIIIPLWLILLVSICILVAILAIVHDRKKKQSGRRKK